MPVNGDRRSVDRSNFDHSPSIRVGQRTEISVGRQLDVLIGETQLTGNLYLRFQRIPQLKALKALSAQRVPDCDQIDRINACIAKGKLGELKVDVSFGWPGR